MQLLQVLLFNHRGSEQINPLHSGLEREEWERKWHLEKNRKGSEASKIKIKETGTENKSGKSEEGRKSTTFWKYIETGRQGTESCSAGRTWAHEDWPEILITNVFSNWCCGVLCNSPAVRRLAVCVCVSGAALPGQTCWDLFTQLPALQPVVPAAEAFPEITRGVSESDRRERSIKVDHECTCCIKFKPHSHIYSLR